MPNGWLTPDFPPARKFYTRKLLIPATTEFLGLVNGALYELCQTHNWEASGEMTEQETADYFLDMWMAYLENDNEPPEWETPDELDGTPAQPWYEDLSDWIIQGFLAVTFTPLAALTYQATVPKLRIAIRTGNLGALFKVLINGVEVWTGDSYSPITDLIDQVFDMSAETEPYTVRIEHNGVQPGHGYTEGKLEVIRGEAVAQMVQTILRADPTGCGIQWSLDEGDTWETIDLATCITGLANDAIDQAIADGRLGQKGTQQGPGSEPIPGECVTYHVVLEPGSLWHCPNLVHDGSTIHISNVSGGWSIGELAWYCPDGTRYLLGICDDTLKTHVTGDPINPGAYHMALIGLFGSTYFDPLSGIYTIPGSTGDTDFFILANTNLTGAPSGQAEFDIEVCSGGWNHTFDWRTGELGWSPWNFAGNLRAAYSAGNGWTYNSDYSTDRIQIQITGLPTGSTFEHVDLWISSAMPGGSNHGVCLVDGSGYVDLPADPGDALHFTGDVSFTNPASAVISMNGNGNQLNGYLYKAIFAGGGTDPF